MKQLFFSMCVMCISAVTVGQQPGADGRLICRIDCHDLYSTHRDHFRGISCSVSKPVSSVLAIGAGAEFSGNRYHFDNDWNLYHLRFLPVFLEQQLKPANSGRICPVFHICEGWTYASYQKETPASPGRRRGIHESGLYLYGGAGLTGNLLNGLSVAAELGIKGFHNSFNDLDVNPHGVTGRLGVIIAEPDVHALLRKRTKVAL